MLGCLMNGKLEGTWKKLYNHQQIKKYIIISIYIFMSYTTIIKLTILNATT